MTENLQKLDHHDLRILDLLQRDSALSRMEIADKVGLSEPQVARRRLALEEAGFICRYRAELDASAIGLAVTAFVHVKLHGHSKGIFKRFADLASKTLVSLKPMP